MFKGVCAMCNLFILNCRAPDQWAINMRRLIILNKGEQADLSEHTNINVYTRSNDYEYDYKCCYNGNIYSVCPFKPSGNPVLQVRIIFRSSETEVLFGMY